MKSKPSLSTILLLAFAAIFVLGCGLASEAASTAAPAADPASTATPVEAPTEEEPSEPVASEDISSAVLTLADLPAGFEELTLEEMGVSLDDFSDEEFQPQNVFVFLNTQNFQMVFGFNFLLTSRLDRASFDIGVSQPDITLPAFVEGMGTQNVRDEKLLAGLDGIGEQQIGMTMVATLEGIPLQVDVLMFRRDVIGEMVMSMYLEGKSPNITINDLGSKLDGNVQETLQTMK